MLSKMQLNKTNCDQKILKANKEQQQQSCFEGSGSSLGFSMVMFGRDFQKFVLHPPCKHVNALYLKKPKLKIKSPAGFNIVRMKRKILVFTFIYG